MPPDQRGMRGKYVGVCGRRLTGRARPRTRFAGFTLIELVVVVVIIAIIAAIAIPKLSRGPAGAGDAALSQDLSTIRAALELYQTEHVWANDASTDVDIKTTPYNTY